MNRLFVRNIRKLPCLAFNWTQPAKIKFHLNESTRTIRAVGLLLVREHQTHVQYAKGYKEKNISKTDTKLDALLLKLHAQSKAIGYLNYEYVNKTVRLLEDQQNELSNQHLLAEQGLFLLRSCGLLLPTQNAKVRLELFERIWKYLAINNHLNYEHYVVRMDVLKHNRMPIDDLARVLLEFKELRINQSQSAELYAALLEVCCCNGNLSQIEQVLEEIKKLNFKLTKRHYNALLLGHGRFGNAKAIQEVLHDIGKQGLDLDMDTQTILVITSLENDDISNASKLLEKHSGNFALAHVIEMLRGLTEDNWNDNLLALIVQELPHDKICQTDLPLELRLVCIEMISKGYLKLLHNIIVKLPKPNFKENESTDSYCVALLREMVRFNIDKMAIKKFCQLLLESEKNARAFHIATEYALRYDASKALDLLQELAQLEELRTHYFWPLLMHNFREHGETGIFDTLKLMQQHNVVVDHMTLAQYVLPRFNLLQTNVSEAIKMLVASGVKPSICISPVISNLLSQSKIAEIIELLQDYSVKLPLNKLLSELATLSINVHITRKYHQFAQLINTIQNTSVPDQMDFVGQLLQQMLATHLRLQTDPQALLRFLKSMQKYNLMLESSATRVIVAQLPTKGMDENQLKQYQQVIQMLHKMSKPLTKGKTTATNEPSSTIENLAEQFNSNTAFDKTPNQMTVFELENHIKELQAKGKNIRGLLRRYLQVCVRDGSLQKALDVKAQCDALRVHESPGMCACVLDLYIKVKDMQNAEKTLQRMKKTYPGFQLDEHKQVDYAALLIEHDRLTEARQLLERHATTQKVIGGEYIVKNIWQLLKSVAENVANKKDTLTEDQNITRDTFNMLNELGYCRVQNTLLGPIIREYLLRQDLRSAVKEFHKIAQQYKCTPLQRELLSLLVRLSNGHEADYEMYKVTASEAQELLQDVCVSISDVHGGINLNSGMLLAFCESGTEKQLRRLLLNPEFSLNQENLIKNCEHLSKSGDIKSLLRLAHSVRGLQNIIDEISIYNMILEKYINENNYEAALNLCNYLEADEDLKVPEKFVHNLVKFLQDNNVDVPSNILLRAKLSS